MGLAMSHNQAHDHAHDHSHPGGALPNLSLALLLTAGFAGVEAAAGWWSGSLALLADAGHMVTDSASLGLAWLATWLAARPPSLRHTYGLGRAEMLAAFINAAAMLTLVAVITAEAWGRFQTPRAIDGRAVSAVALVGLGVNLLVAWILTRGERDLNIRAALLHVLGDTLGSLAAIASGVVILATGWTPIDPLLSVLIGGLILSSSVGLLKQSLHALLDGVPPDMPLERVGKALAAVPGVVEVHDLHVWSLSSRRIALSAHVTLRDLEAWPQTLSSLHETAARQGIDHATFQPEIHTQTLRWPGRPEVRQIVDE